MSLGTAQLPDYPTFSISAEHPTSGFGFGVVTEATVGHLDLATAQDLVDTLRAGGWTVNARLQTGQYQEINTP